MVVWTKQWYLIISGYFPKYSPSPTHVSAPGPNSTPCLSDMLPLTVPVSLCSFFPPHLPLDINRASGPSFPSRSKSGESSSESFRQVPVMLNCRRRRLSCHLSGTPMWITMTSSFRFHRLSSLLKWPEPRPPATLFPTPTPNDHKNRRLRTYSYLRGNLPILQNMFPKKRGEHLHVPMESTTVLKQGGALEKGFS